MVLRPLRWLMEYYMDILDREFEGDYIKNKNVKQNQYKFIKMFHIRRTFWESKTKAIPADLTEEFKDLLIHYYEGKDEKQIKEFFKVKCYMSI